MIQFIFGGTARLFINHWNNKSAVYKTPFSDAELSQLRHAMVAAHKHYSFGPEIWQSHFHNVFETTDPLLLRLRDYFTFQVDAFCAPHRLEIESTIAGEVLRTPGQEINEHSDREDGHVTAHLFLDGPPLDFDLERDFAARVNMQTENSMALNDPATRAREMRLPWETPHSIWIKPHRGLMVMFSSRLPHMQKPHLGKEPFVQISMVARFKILPGMQWARKPDSEILEFESPL